MINTSYLRALRVDRGYSIRGLAKAVGVDHQTIRRLENGADPGDLPLRVLDRIATALGVRPAMLLANGNAAEGHELQERIGGTIMSAPGISLTNLAAAVAMPIDEVDAALPALDTALTSVGLTLTRDGDDLRVTPRAVHSAREADTKPMTVTEARLLRRIHRGEDVRRTMSKADRTITIPSLARRGSINIATTVPAPTSGLCRRPPTT
ncbi:helix-turn-helix domain-containing protein [Nocardioides sp. SYSU DS0651]|uniref:helix-turn-helix domain-containing protein n=1 Tax=Nocardioides sp. SYSU DS0651 TaxID=3415955 RepID=UPI003F4C81CC